MSADRTILLLVVASLQLLAPAFASGQLAQGPPRPPVVQEGWAIPYPDIDRPRRTSSGDVYSPYAMTAAHRTLPMGTTVELLSLSSGRRVLVRINDRGPFVPNRIADISEAAARSLGFGSEGGRVRLRVVRGTVTADGQAALSLERDEPPAEQPVSRRQTGEFTVQLGSYGDEAGARKIANQIEGAWIYRIRVEDNWFYRVNFGVFSTREEAETFRLRLAARNIDGFVKTVEEHEKETVLD